jgi:mono/diheme cytochrome c family protein
VLKPTLSTLLSVLAVAILPWPARAESPVSFNRDIRPILSNNCFQCHGPDAKARKGGTEGSGGMRLDTAEGATEAILPGKPDDSPLIQRVSSRDPDEAMPPKSTGKKLTPREVELLRTWVKQGAKYSPHWSYIKPVRPELPAVKNAAWVRNAIDRFILARLEREGLSPQPEADRYALIRRVSLDLTGLPPTIEEVDAFVNDRDPLAYEKLVDRLLAKEAYGEHWAHMWLDLARYADSAGYADDPARTIWLFRDYVIRSLNGNKPFDQFTVEQIAGDLLPDPTQEQLTATAFHRNTLTNNEGGTNDEEFRNVAVVDRVNTTMAVWMGTTIACAQCHDHKYDPISQAEFFRFFAFFNNTQDADRTDESPLLSIYTPEQERQRKAWQDEITRLETALRTPTPELRAAQAKWETAFPRDLKWSVIKPTAVKSQAGAKSVLAVDGAVSVAAGATNDTYTLELPLEGGKLRALRLEALPDDSLPGKGPGHADGNFVITRLAATIKPPKGQSPVGRFVRVELPGKQKLLSLAEVQAFRGSDNVARGGEARQSSTDYDGPARLAIDGNTDGRYNEARSTTHTAQSDDPWWEVDLKSAQPIDRIAVWNRADGVEARLANFRVLLLNERREAVWQQTVAQPPRPSVELSLSGSRSVEFSAAVADYAQANFEPANVLKNPDPKNRGWAVGGQTGQPHALTLITTAAVDVPAGSKLVVTIEQASKFAGHTLGRFRMSITDDARVAQWAGTPASVLAALTIEASKRSPAQTEAIMQYYLSIAPEVQPSRQKLAELQQQLAALKPNTVPIMREMDTSGRRVTKVQHRGNFLDLGKQVAEGTPAAFHPLPAGAPMNRLTLAKWLVDENNPLTARVIANRYWEQVFGIGIVASSEEFGAQGELPYHPELLDWLACELVAPSASGGRQPPGKAAQWDLKAFLKLLVTSATYRQSSKVSPELVQRDPDNRLMARGPRFRLSAEMVRDQALAVSGLLSSKMYGPPVKPPQPSIGLSAAFGSGIDWQTSAGDDRYRRGLYTTWRRSNPYPSMATFDAPNREVCTVRRVRTNTPLQALVTLNDPVYIEAAQALARRIVASGGSSSSDRVRYALRAVLSRPPQAAELSRLEKLYAQSLARFAKQPEAARKLATEPLGAPPKEMNVAELAAWTVVGNVLLNLDEALMKR